jgi:hypothetical protein
MYHRETGCGGMAPDINRWRALVNIVTKLWVAQNVGKFLSSRVTGEFRVRCVTSVACL